MSDCVRRQAFFQGRVQGVGFRFSTHDVARSFSVVGFVRNLPNGDVEVVVEGTSAETHAFIEAVKEARPGNIDSVDLHTLAPTHEFKRFEIRR